MTTKSTTLPYVNAKPTRRRTSAARRREAIEGILYLSPWIIGFLVFVVGPLVASLYLGFTKYNVLRPPQWIGWQNYTFAFTKDELFAFHLA